MIEESARVIQIEGDFAWVETERKSSCESCSVNKGCGTSTLAKVLGQRRNQIRVLNPVAARPGEEVVIGIKEDVLVRGSFAVYLVPLLALLAGALLGESLFGSELATVVSGIAGLLVGFLWLRRFTAKINADTRFQPVVLRRVVTLILPR